MKIFINIFKNIKNKYYNLEKKDRIWVFISLISAILSFIFFSCHKFLNIEYEKIYWSSILISIIVIVENLFKTSTYLILSLFIFLHWIFIDKKISSNLILITYLIFFIIFKQIKNNKYKKILNMSMFILLILILFIINFIAIGNK